MTDEIHRREKGQTSKSERFNTKKPALFGRRAYLSKKGREVANAAAEDIFKREPLWINEYDDPSLGQILVYLDRDGPKVAETQAETLTSLLTKGLSCEEAIVFFLYEHSGLTLREIYLAKSGNEMDERAEQQRQAELTIASTIKQAGEKLGYDLEIAVE